MNIGLGFGHLKDGEFLAAFENCTFDPSNFHHADHVRLAWIYVHRVGAIAAEQRLVDGIRKLATHAGAPNKFLHTATIAWARLVALAVEKDPSKLPFSAWITKHPELLNKDLLDQFYSSGILKTEPARAQWVEPDRKPLNR
jgi:hypothetical protein